MCEKIDVFMCIYYMYLLNNYLFIGRLAPLAAVRAVNFYLNVSIW